MINVKNTPVNSNLGKVNRRSGLTTGTTNYADIIASLAERLAPGGELEQGEFSRIDVETQAMANRMEGANIARGLGNATMGVAPTATRMGLQAKGQARSNLLGQYLSTLQFLMSAGQQQQSLDTQTASLASGTQTNAQQGLDAFGKPMRGTLAEAEMNLAQAKLQAAMNPESITPEAEAYPSLYNSNMDLDFGQNPFIDSSAQQAQQFSTHDPWGPLKGYGELESGLSAGSR